MYMWVHHAAGTQVSSHLSLSQCLPLGATSQAHVITILSFPRAWLRRGADLLVDGGFDDSEVGIVLRRAAGPGRSRLVG